MRRAERLHALAEALRRAGATGRTAQAVAHELAVTVRTIRRDVDSLAAAGVPIWRRPGPGGGIGIAEHGSMRAVALSDDQLIAISAALATASGAPFADSARAALAKVLDGVPADQRNRVATSAARVWVDHGDEPPRRVMSAVERGLVDQRVLAIRYRDRAGVTTRRDVEPIIVALHHGHWSLVAWCRLRRAIRWFDLLRVETASVTRRDCAGHSVAEIGEPPPSARPASS